MLKGLRLSVMMLALAGLLFTACGDDDDGDDKPTCTTACQTYEECTATDTCTVKAGMCKTDTDCADDGDKTSCDTATNTCVVPTTVTCTPTCDDWKECTATDTCTLKDGMCDSSTDCTDAVKTDCDTATHTCVEPAGSCTENDVKCVGAVVNTCDANGDWVAGTDCALNTDGMTECKNGACAAPAVTPETKTVDEVKAMTEGVVSVEGLTVTHQELSTKGNVKGYYVEKDGKGLHVRVDPAIAADGLPVAGDVVTLVGKVDHFNGRSQVTIVTKEGEEVGSITKTADGTVPEAVTGVLPLADPQESVVVKLDGMFTITEIGAQDNSWNTKLTYDTDKELVMRSDLYRFNEGDNAAQVGDIYTSITGYITEWNGTFSIQPRKAEDLVKQ